MKQKRIELAQRYVMDGHGQTHGALSRRPGGDDQCRPPRVSQPGGVKHPETAGFHLHDVKDDGRSFQMELVMHSRSRNHLGLLGMRERLEMIEGRLGIESAPGKGTTIRAEVPLANGDMRENGNRLMDSVGTKLESL
jgi:hypothetical protein